MASSASREKLSGFEVGILFFGGGILRSEAFGLGVNVTFWPHAHVTLVFGSQVQALFWCSVFVMGLTGAVPAAAEGRLSAKELGWHLGIAGWMNIVGQGLSLGGLLERCLWPWTQELRTQWR